MLNKTKSIEKFCKISQGIQEKIKKKMLINNIFGQYAQTLFSNNVEKYPDFDISPYPMLTQNYFRF